MPKVSSPLTRPPTDAESLQAEMIRGVAEGDDQALASLYDATSRTVYGLLLRVLSDPSSAEEVLLDVYAQVWRQAAAYSAERGRRTSAAAASRGSSCATRPGRGRPPTRRSRRGRASRRRR